MTFYIFTLGCKVNSYESAAIMTKMKEEGFLYDEKNPDIVIVNTCSVTHVADQKSRQHIRKFKSNNPNAIIAVMGCYAQGNAEYILNECNADIVLGTSKRSEIVAKIKDFIANHQKIIDIGQNPRCFEYEELGVNAYSENIRAYLKIQDGCDNFCTYCIVPYRRGKSRSRSFDSIIEEAKELARKGYKEIVLSGIHIGKYGQDIGTSFSNLVEALCKIDDIYRIRISSIEESEIDDKLINLIIHEDKLAKHLHIPLQSGSDYVLKRMGRKYNTTQFLEKLNYIRSYLPNICYTTDLIVGFPGESEEYFTESYEFLKKVGFNQIHVFPYSPREGTPAASYKDQVNPSIKSQRVKKVLALSAILWEDYCKKCDGEEVEVIVEKIDEKTFMYSGHSSNYLLINNYDKNVTVGSIVKTMYKY